MGRQAREDHQVMDSGPYDDFDEIYCVNAGRDDRFRRAISADWDNDSVTRKSSNARRESKRRKDRMKKYMSVTSGG